jgi:hypothetical protein
MAAKRFDLSDLPRKHGDVAVIDPITQCLERDPPFARVEKSSGFLHDPRLNVNAQRSQKCSHAQLEHQHDPGDGKAVMIPSPAGSTTP